MSKKGEPKQPVTPRKSRGPKPPPAKPDYALVTHIERGTTRLSRQSRG